jgi:hypothetical protein
MMLFDFFYPFTRPLLPSSSSARLLHRTSAARPSRHLAVAVASTPAAYKTLSFLAPVLLELTVVLLHHFISAEQDRKPRIHHCRPTFVPGELCSPWAATVSLPLLKLTPEQASSSPTVLPELTPTPIPH